MLRLDETMTIQPSPLEYLMAFAIAFLAEAL